MCFLLLPNPHYVNLLFFFFSGVTHRMELKLITHVSGLKWITALAQISSLWVMHPFQDVSFKPGYSHEQANSHKAQIFVISTFSPQHPPTVSLQCVLR